MITKRDLRAWSLLLLLLLLGIIFMLIVGQIAIHLRSSWQVNAGMGSNLDPDA